MNKANNIPSASDKKTKMSKKSVIFRILKYLFAHKAMLLLAALLMITANLLSLEGPELSGKAIDAIGEGGNMNFKSVLFYTGLMVLFYAVSAALSYLLSIIMISISKSVTYRMRKDVFEHLCDLPIGYFDKNQSGDIVSRLTYDIDTVNTSLSNDLVHILSGSITVIVCGYQMFKIAPILMLVFTVTIPALIFFSRYRVKKVRPLFSYRSAKYGFLNGFAEEMLSGQKTIRAYSKEKVIISRFDVHNDEAVEAEYNADYQGCILGPSVNFINNITLSLIGMFGVLIFIKTKGSPEGAMFTIGALSSFIQYARRFSGPINETANIVSDIQSAISAGARIFRLLDEGCEPKDSDASEKLSESGIAEEGDLKVNDLTFGYTEERKVLHNIFIDAPKGKTIALVGATGCGKTSIINLLMRFYDPDSGEILIDGVNTQKAPISDVRRSFAMVLQDTWLFGGTVAENIAYGRNDVSFEEIVEAAKTAKVHSFIKSLPDGYNTVIDENGSNISKGQKQLITIARAILLDTPFLILDEATSNVDSHTEALLHTAMDAAMKDRTCIIVAHRLSTIKNADTIIVMDKGRILEKGSHDELLALGGSYAALYNSQFDTLLD